MSFDARRYRSEFPLLGRIIGENPVVYLDSAATAQMPRAVMDAMRTFESQSRGNVHRGMHPLAEEATDAFEHARETVRAFLNAAHTDEIIFTKGTTESINIVARGMDALLSPGDTVAVSLLEHHSNIVPWQQLKERRGITIRWIDIQDDGQLHASSLAAALEDPSLKLLAITGLSNVLGVRVDLQAIVKAAHEAGACVLMDAAQLVAHDTIDVQALDVDFLALSGHKLYGPTGIGVLYGKRELLKKLPPLLGGGMMIEEVTQDGFTPADAPAKFEAGTPPVTEAVGLATAIDWLTAIPMKERRAHEQELYAYAYTALQKITGVVVLSPEKGEGVISFIVEGIHPHDLTSMLGSKGICLRAGHHCAQPLHRRLGRMASARLSIALYNTKEDIDRLIAALPEIIRTLS